MISFDEFEDMVDDILATFPEDLFRELNGGVFAREEIRYNSAGIAHDLIICGEYHVDRYLGRFIVLYYGSIMRVFGYLGEDDLRREVRRILLHEFTHHMESLAGEKDLEKKDAAFLRKYMEEHSRERKYF